MPALTLYRANGLCSLAAHALLTHLSIPFNPVLMKPGPNGLEAADGSLTHQDYLTIHPLGYIPALVTTDGDTITELTAILFYIGSLTEGQQSFNIIGHEGLERAKLIEWMAFLATAVHSTGLAMMSRPKRFLDDENLFGGLADKGSKWLEHCFAIIEQRLKGTKFTIGDHLTVADFHTYSFWRGGEAFGILMKENYPKLAAVMSQVEQLQGISKAVEVEGLKLSFSKHQLGSPGGK